MIHEFQVFAVIASFLIDADSSTPRKTRKTDTSKVPELLRQHLKKRYLMEDEIDAEEIEPPALGALSMIDQEENGDRCKAKKIFKLFLRSQSICYSW